MRRWRGAFRARIDQRHRLLKRHRVRRLVGRQRRVDAVVADIGAIAAVLRNDRAALDRMVAERPAWIGAKAASARALGTLLGDERHRAIETDREYLLRRLQIGVGLAMLNVGSEPADAGADRLAILGMAAHFARQR